MSTKIKRFKIFSVKIRKNSLRHKTLVSNKMRQNTLYKHVAIGKYLTKKQQGDYQHVRSQYLQPRRQIDFFASA